MLAAGVLFLPWAPTFVFQMLHTGTPWAQQVHAEVLLDTVFSWAGPASAGALLALVLLLMAFIGYSARPVGRRPAPAAVADGCPGRYLVAMWLVPLVLAYGTYAFGGSAYAERYTGISLPPFLLLAGLGIGLLPSRSDRHRPARADQRPRAARRPVAQRRRAHQRGRGRHPHPAAGPPG